MNILEARKTALSTVLIWEYFLISKYNKEVSKIYKIKKYAFLGTSNKLDKFWKNSKLFTVKVLKFNVLSI